MRFGISIPQSGLSWTDLLDRTLLAESLGFEDAWGFDHLSWRATKSPWGTMEGMTALGALAAKTSSIRLGLLVANVTFRAPALAASQLSTIDQISGGRLNVGLGLGWDRAESKLLRLPFPPAQARIASLASTIEYIDKAFVGSGVDGSSADSVPLFARPAQASRPPVWIGGAGGTTSLPVAAWYADVWHAYGTPESLRERMDRLDELARRAGRRPGQILRASSLDLNQGFGEIRDAISRWEDGGWDYLVCEWPRTRGSLDEFAESYLS